MLTPADLAAFAAIGVSEHTAPEALLPAIRITPELDGWAIVAVPTTTALPRQ